MTPPASGCFASELGQCKAGGTMLRACAVRSAVARAPRPAISIAIRQHPVASQSCRRPATTLSVAPPKFLESIGRASAFSAPYRKFSSQKPPAPAPVASSTTPHVDLLAKYGSRMCGIHFLIIPTEQKAARRQKLYRWGAVLLVIAVLIALAMWYGEGHRASSTN